MGKLIKAIKFSNGLTRNEMLRKAHQQFPGVYRTKRNCSAVIKILSMQSMTPPVFKGKRGLDEPPYKPPLVKRITVDASTKTKKLVRTFMPRLRYETDRPPCRIQQYNEGELAFKSPLCLLFQLHSMDAAKLFALKAAASEKNLKLSFVRPTITQYLCQQNGDTNLIPLCKGPMILAYATKDTVEPHDIKDIFEQIENSKKLLLVSGRIYKQLFSPEECRRIVKEMPSRKQMLSELISTLQSPVHNIVGLLSSPLNQMARLLEARRRQLE